MGQSEGGAPSLGQQLLAAGIAPVEVGKALMALAIAPSGVAGGESSAEALSLLVQPSGAPTAEMGSGSLLALITSFLLMAGIPPEEVGATRLRAVVFLGSFRLAPATELSTLLPSVAEVTTLSGAAPVELSTLVRGAPSEAATILPQEIDPMIVGAQAYLPVTVYKNLPAPPTLADPTELRCTVECRTTGTRTVAYYSTSDVVRDSVGAYHYVYQTTAPGHHVVNWTASGAIVAVGEMTFEVTPSQL